MPTEQTYLISTGAWLKALFLEVELLYAQRTCRVFLFVVAPVSILYAGEE